MLGPASTAPAPAVDPLALQTAMDSLPIQPSLGEVQRAALARAQLSQRDVRRWLRRARSAAWLPTVSGGYDLRSDRGWSLDREPGLADALKDDLGNTTTWRFKAAWELDRLLFEPDELRAARAALDLIDWRERVLVDVTRLYFERQALLLTGHLVGPGDVANAVNTEMRIREIEGVLSGLTGIGKWPRTSTATAPPFTRPGASQ
jgi:hypothetical protein